MKHRINYFWLNMVSMVTIASLVGMVTMWLADFQIVELFGLLLVLFIGSLFILAVGVDWGDFRKTADKDFKGKKRRKNKKW